MQNIRFFHAFSLKRFSFIYLSSSMVSLVKRVLTNYMPVTVVKDYADADLINIRHMERSVQLIDTDLFIGTDARVLLTTLEEDTQRE